MQVNGSFCYLKSCARVFACPTNIIYIEIQLKFVVTAVYENNNCCVVFSSVKMFSRNNLKQLADYCLFTCNTLMGDPSVMYDGAKRFYYYYYYTICLKD